MAAGGGAGAITVWDLEKRRLQTIIRDAHDAPLLSLHFFPGEPRLMSSAGDNSLKQVHVVPHQWHCLGLRSQCKAWLRTHLDNLTLRFLHDVMCVDTSLYTVNMDQSGEQQANDARAVVIR